MRFLHGYVQQLTRFQMMQRVTRRQLSFYSLCLKDSSSQIKLNRLFRVAATY